MQKGKVQLSDESIKNNVVIYSSEGMTKPKATHICPFDFLQHDATQLAKYCIANKHWKVMW